MSIFPVTEKKEKALFDKMQKLGVKESEIQESFIRCGGNGGQHLNKTSTGVYLKHIPTGIDAKCQKERSQALNRYFARVVLLNKIDYLINGKKSDGSKKLDKIRKQKQKRAKRSKQKILKQD